MGDSRRGGENPSFSLSKGKKETDCRGEKKVGWGRFSSKACIARLKIPNSLLEERFAGGISDEEWTE